VGHQNITCSSQELVTLNPPSGLACGDYMQIYISNFGGYLVNPAATDSCVFCSSRTTDAFLESAFNMKYSHRLRDFWVILGYIVFNVSTRHLTVIWSNSRVHMQTCCIYGFTYWFHIRTGNLLVSIKKRIIRKSRWFTTRPDEEMQLEKAALLPNP
jgi:ATP-binding cassette subfamily G (WHITE) protein 2 (SNQ2)